jgi:hypothetical protein
MFSAIDRGDDATGGVGNDSRFGKASFLQSLNVSGAVNTRFEMSTREPWFASGVKRAT